MIRKSDKALNSIFKQIKYFYTLGYFQNDNNFQNFEFHGDKTLDYFVSNIITQTYYALDEGFLTQKLSSIVNNQNLSDTFDYLQLSNIFGDNFSTKQKADYVEAIIGELDKKKLYSKNKTEDLLSGLTSIIICVSEFDNNFKKVSSPTLNLNIVQNVSTELPGKIIYIDQQKYKDKIFAFLKSKNYKYINNDNGLLGSYITEEFGQDIWKDFKKNNFYNINLSQFK